MIALFYDDGRTEWRDFEAWSRATTVERDLSTDDGWRQRVFELGEIAVALGDGHGGYIVASYYAESQRGHARAQRAAEGMLALGRFVAGLGR